MAMPPTNILLGMSVPYFGTDGEKATGVSGRDMSIANYTTSAVKTTTTFILPNGRIPEGQKPIQAGNHTN